MNTKKYNNFKDMLYVFSFLFIIFLKWNIGNVDVKLINMVLDQIFFLPAVLLISLFYFHYQYYNNIFVITRIGKSKTNRTHLLSILKECIIFPIYLLVLVVLLSFRDYHISNLLPIVICFLLIISFYILLGFIYFFGYIFLKKFYMCFLLNLIPIFIYKFYIIWWKQFIATFDISRISNNLILIVINVVVIIFIMLVTMYQKEKKNIKLNSLVKSVILYGVIEFLSIICLRNYIMIPDSYSFQSLLFMDTAERIVGLLFWVAPKIYIIFYMFQYIYDNYKHNLIFYMVRISNREKWIRKHCLQIMIYLLIVSVMKLLLSSIMFRVISVNLLLSTGYYFLYLLFISMSIIMIYLFFKDVSVANFYLSCYFIFMAIISIFSIDILDFLLLSDSMIGIVVFVIGIVIGYGVSVLILNNDEYYG